MVELPTHSFGLNMCALALHIQNVMGEILWKSTFSFFTFSLFKIEPIVVWSGCSCGIIDFRKSQFQRLNREGIYFRRHSLFHQHIAWTNKGNLNICSSLITEQSPFAVEEQWYNGKLQKAIKWTLVKLVCQKQLFSWRNHLLILFYNQL